MAESSGPPPAPQAVGSGSELLDQVLWEYARAKIQKLDIVNYAGANMAFNHARDIEKKLGLPSSVTPFPSPTNISVSQVQPAPQQQQQTTPPPSQPASALSGPLGWLAAAGVASVPPTLLALILALRGGASPTAATPPTYPGPADSAYKVQFYDKDGKLIPVPHINDKPK